MGTSSKKTTVGYFYYCGVHFTLCHGVIDKVTRIRCSERLLTNFTPISDGGRHYWTNTNFFGGEEREGGMSGVMDFSANGSWGKGISDYLQVRCGPLTPAFRGVMQIVLEGWYLGLNPYLKPWDFRVSRIMKTSEGLQQWNPGTAMIAGPDGYENMNPAHIIRECITDPIWGMGYPGGNIDDTTFVKVANTLYAEELGLSIIWQNESPVQDFIVEILRHIDGVLYVNRQTGAFSLKLIRGDYVIDDLLVLTDGIEISEIKSYQRVSNDERNNTVTIKYWDPTLTTDNAVTVSDAGLLAQQGKESRITVNFPGVTSAGVAATLAQRELRTASAPLLSVDLICTRVAANLEVGDVFKLVLPDHHEGYVVMRVLSIGLGDTMKHAVTVKAIEDVFATPGLIPSEVPEEGSQWEDPLILDDTLPTQQIVMEAPYYELVTLLGQSEVDGGLEALPEAGYIAGALTYTGNGINSQLYIDNGAGYEETETTIDYGASVVIARGANPDLVIDPWDERLYIEHGTWDRYERVTVPVLALLGDELVQVIGSTSIESNHVDVIRGVLDSVPKTHPPNTVLYIIGDSLEGHTQEYVQGEIVGAKMVPQNGTSRTDPDLIDGVTVEFDARAIRPYPPANLTNNNFHFPPQVNRLGMLRWAHRDRTQQTGEIMVDWFDSGNIGPEPGTTYQLYVWKFDGTLDLAIEGITDNEYQLPWPNYDWAGLQLFSYRDGFRSWEPAYIGNGLDFTAPEPTQPPDPDEGLEPGERYVTYGELATYGGYGTVEYGAITDE